MLDNVAVQEPVVGLDFAETRAIIEKPKELAVQCVLTVGNVLTDKQMRSPNYRLGGRLYPWPDFYTVPKGIVARCAITRLQDAYRGIHKSQIPEREWPQWVNSYTLTNQWDPVTKTYKDIVVGVDGASKDLLYKAIKPINEIGRIAYRGEGVVSLGEECGLVNGEAIRDAQFHYFPDWLEIIRGVDGHWFPDTLAALEDHLSNRRAVASSSTLRAVGDAYLQSCSEFRSWAKADRIDIQTAAIKETDKFAGGARYDEVTERLFKELELTREDQLVQGIAKSNNTSAAQSAQMAEAITLLTNLVVAQNRAADTLPQAEVQAPAPATAIEAEAEILHATEAIAIPAAAPEPDTFVDMSEVVPDPADAEVNKYLEGAGVETKEANDDETHDDSDD